jgi:hypothetical protein
MNMNDDDSLIVTAHRHVWDRECAPESVQLAQGRP